MKKINDYLIYELENPVDLQPTVTVIGDLNYDYIYQCPLLQSGKEVIIESFEKHMAGAGGYFSAGISKLGATVYLLTRIGDDEDGRNLLKEAEKLGIRTDGIMVIEKEKTPFTLIFTQKGEEQKRQVATYLGTLKDLSSENVPWEKCLKKSMMVYSCNYFLLKKLREEIRFIFKGAKKIGLITAYDANAGDGWENQKELQTLKNYIYPNTDLIFLNHDEARHLTGLSDPFKSILKIEKNAKTVVIKLGKDGALIRHLDKLYRIGGFPIGSRVADTVGAGDAFQAAFSYFYLRKKPIEICGIMGCANGATTVLHHGGLDGQCTTEELKRFISQFDILDMGNRTIQIKPRGYISRYA